MMILPGLSLLLLAFASAINAAEPEGCTSEGKSFKVGEQYNVPGNCASNVCMDDGRWEMVSCGLVGGPDKWVYLPEDPSKPYPECCGRVVPPLDIVPDVLDKLSWSETLQVNYEGGHKVDLGNELTPTQVKSEPTVSYKADPDSYYLLCMTDPDAPSRQDPNSQEFFHWLVGNIPGDGGVFDVSKGEALAEYVGSGPPQGTGLHRYVFLLYKQPGKLTFVEPRVNKTTWQGRKSISIQKFAEKYKLDKPLAINVYQARYDDYVPELHKQLGFIKSN